MNAVHGSDSDENAIREADFSFQKLRGIYNQSFLPDNNTGLSRQFYFVSC